MERLESLLFLSENDVQQLLTVTDAVELARKGVIADANGSVVGNKYYMPVSDRGFVKPFSGYIEGEDTFYVKTFSYFPKNPERFGCPTTSSMVILFDAENGLPVCLMEAGWVTGLKTAASTAVTASMLATRRAEKVTIFGAGMLGEMHLRALHTCFDLKNAYFVDIIHSTAMQKASLLQDTLGISVGAIAFNDREDAVRESDIIVTVTTGNFPMVAREWLKPGAFVARLGSYQEVALDVITQADKVIVDNWHYVHPRIPELITLEKQGAFGFNKVYAQWLDIVSGRTPGRETENEVIVYIALGIWGEYAAILPEVYRRAVASGVGTTLQSSHIPTRR